MNKTGRALKGILFALPVFILAGLVGVGFSISADAIPGPLEQHALPQSNSIAETESAQTWFVGIGIAEYQNQKWPRLRNARTDMLDIFAALKSGYGFDDAHSILLIDSLATRRAILDTLRRVSSSLDDNDNIVVYYSGHGFYDEASRDGYWVPNNASTSSLGSLISYHELLQGIVRPSKALHFVIIVDACFGGWIFAEEPTLAIRGVKADTAEEETYYDKIGAIRSREAFTSGRQEEVSDGGGAHSPFAQAILDFCNSGRGRFTVSEMAEDVEKRVSMKTKQLPRYGRLNNVGDEGGKFVFRRK